MSDKKKKKRVYKYSTGGNTNRAQRQARRFRRRTARKNKKSDGVNPEKTRSIKNTVSNVVGGIAALGNTAVAVKKHFSTGK